MKPILSSKKRRLPNSERPQSKVYKMIFLADKRKMNKTRVKISDIVAETITDTDVATRSEFIYVHPSYQRTSAHVTQ